MELTKGYKQTEVGIIPEDWKILKLGDIGRTFGGLSGKSKGDFIDGTSPYIPFMNIMTNPIIDSNYFDYVNLKAGESQNSAIKGDLFFNGSSETPEEVGMCSVLLDDISNLYLNSFCFGFRLQKELNIDGLYLSYYFRSKEGRKLFYSMAQGATRYNLSKANFNQISIPVPALREQIAIANALSDTDAYITSIEKLIEKKRQIKQGAMQELLKPKDGWVEKSLGDIAEIIMGQSPLSENYNINGVGLPLIQGNADIKNRKTIIRNYTSQITKKARVGDIIMSVRAPVGEISKTTFNCCIGRGVCSIRYENDFLYHYLIYVENKWGTYSSGSTFDSVNSSQVLGLKLYIPEIIEQIRIAETLTSIDEELTALKEMLVKAKSIKDGMMQNLLTGKIRLI